MGIDGGDRHRFRWQHLGYRPVWRLRIARHKLRRFTARPDPRIRSLRQAPKGIWSWDVREPAQDHRRQRGQPMGRRQWLERWQGPAGFQIQPGWQAFAYARQGGCGWAWYRHI